MQPTGSCRTTCRHSKPGALAGGTGAVPLTKCPTRSGTATLSSLPSSWKRLRRSTNTCKPCQSLRYCSAHRLQCPGRFSTLHFNNKCFLSAQLCFAHTSWLRLVCMGCESLAWEIKAPVWQVQALVQYTVRLTSQSLSTSVVVTAVALSVAWLLQVQRCPVPSDPLCV